MKIVKIYLCVKRKSIRKFVDIEENGEKLKRREIFKSYLNVEIF